LKRSLIEQYLNSANFSDGEIYLKIRHYQSEPNVFAESRWWSYLSKSKQRYLKLFVKHSTLAAGFDALRVLPALFGGLKIGTLDKAAASKCVEVSKLRTCAAKLLNIDRRLPITSAIFSIFGPRSWVKTENSWA